MKLHSHDELNEIYKEAETCDRSTFSEMRSNLLLVSGNHYSKKNSSFFAKVRQSSKASDSQKLRITRNHIHRIVRTYANSINSAMPGVIVAPHSDLEMQDRKSADLNNSVKVHLENKYNLKRFYRDLVDDFCEIGEMHAFIYWDPSIGEVVGYEQRQDDLGKPLFNYTQNEDGTISEEPVADEEKPVFSGGFRFKNIPGFNVLRSPAAKKFQDSPYVIIREMVPVKELQATYGDAAKKAIGEGDQEEFIVFDANSKEYKKEDKQVLVLYTFFRPCKNYPKGYFYISTERDELESGELPAGVFPVVSEGFDTYSTNPRGYSIIKVARPYQAEINRMSSQMATHHVTLGDDKIIYQGGTKLATGALLPGVRGITYQGAPPQILPGRDGGQFLPHLSATITEMYQACLLDEVNIEKDSGQVDPYALLFRSAKQKRQLSRYIEKVENFQKFFWELTLQLAKFYLPENETIQAIGKSEAINIAEFKSTSPLHYTIKIQPQAEDISDNLGQQMALDRFIQYAGQQLSQEQLALVAKEMPFLKNSPIVKKLTLDYDNADNDMLSLERGRMPTINKYAKNEIYIDSVTHRMKQADFQMLPQNVQMAYTQYLQMHEAQVQEKQLAIQKAKSEFIPTGGPLITVQMQVPDPSSSSGTRQVRLGADTMTWLLQQLEAQGTSQQYIEQVNGGVLQDMGYGADMQQVPPQGSPPQFLN